MFVVINFNDSMKTMIFYLLLFLISITSLHSKVSTHSKTFNYTAEKTFDEANKLDIPITISVHLGKIVFASNSFLTNYPDGIKYSIADDLGRIFSNRVTNEGDVNIIANLNKLALDFKPWGFLWLPLIGLGAPTGKEIGIVELQVNIIDSRTGDQILSYSVNKRVSKWTGLYYGKGNSDFSSHSNLLYQSLQNAINDIQKRIISDRDKIEKHRVIDMSNNDP